MPVITVEYNCVTQKLRTLTHLAETDNKTLFSQIKRVLQDKVRKTLTTLKLVPNFTMMTDWEIYLDMAIDMYKRLCPDKLKGKIFEEEKRKKSSGSGKTTEKANTLKPARADDKGKGTSSSSGTSNNKSDSKLATSGSGMMKLSGSSSGSQQSGQKKLDPKKKYKVHLVTTQELVTDDEDESPKATVGTLSVTSPHILEEVVPLTPTTHISEEQSGLSGTAKTAETVQVTESPAPNLSGDSYRVRLPWLRKRIADSATALGIHDGSISGFPNEYM
ncbi:hypothetical protein WOLCODRAFT_152758 [Wolfiporia cocos MD-104 SS10]|uniref:Uncharacterized protein n=1 Tax=Wolfiporia cocos (strain MD-104) TaxID=742152 RepID=A0A2H3JKJ1_WOLCO|nr:hypothetical protein WOLCODRAFT_152758 [Wolfiporia cocos MD-104 SS10]